MSDHGIPPEEQGVLQGVLYTEILDRVNQREDHDVRLRSMTGVDDILDDILGVIMVQYATQKYDRLAELYTRDVLWMTVQSFRVVDGQKYSPFSIARRAFQLTQPMRFQSIEDYRAGNTGAKMLRHVSPVLWEELVAFLTSVVQNIYTATNDQSGRMVPLYRVLAKYTIMYGMALVHEVIESSNHDPQTPLEWKRPLWEQQIIEQHQAQLPLLRQMLYTGAGVHIPSTTTARKHWSMVWSALSEAQKEEHATTR